MMMFVKTVPEDGQEVLVDRTEGSSEVLVRTGAGSEFARRSWWDLTR